MFILKNDVTCLKFNSKLPFSNLCYHITFCWFNCYLTHLQKKTTCMHFLTCRPYASLNKINEIWISTCLEKVYYRNISNLREIYCQYWHVWRAKWVTCISSIKVVLLWLFSEIHKILKWFVYVWFFMHVCKQIWICSA